MTKSAMPHGKLDNKQWLSPASLIRVGSILIVGLMIGHVSAYPGRRSRPHKKHSLRC